MSLLTTAGRALLLTTTWGSGSYKVALLRPTYTPSAADSLASAITSHEVTGAGYAAGYGGAGRKALASKTVTATVATDKVAVDAADLTWTTLDAGVVAYAAILLESGGSDATSTLVAVLDVPVTLTDGTDFTLTWAPSGLWSL
jgi:hypothetical protein